MMRSKVRKSTREQTKADRIVEGRLASLEKGLVAALRTRLDRVRTSSADDAVEFMEIAVNGEIDDLAARLAESDAFKIDEIEQALEMLRLGRYGICRVCGKRIASRRLEACPFATLCIRCKQKQEGVEGAGAASPAGDAHAEIGSPWGDEDDDGDAMAADLFRESEIGKLF